MNARLTALLDPLERASRTFIQQFSVIMLASGTTGLLAHQNWLLGVDSAGFAAIVSLLTSVLTLKVPVLSKQLDLLMRAGKTFVQSFVGTLTAANVLSVSHADWKGALAVAVPTALTALLSGSVPSMIPARLLVPTVGNYQPGAITDPSVELDENSNPVVENTASAVAPTADGDADGRHRAEA